MAVECPHAFAPARTRQLDAVHGIGNAARSVLDTLSTWGRRIRERQQLSNLDDRMLQDIGITRADAHYLGDKPFWRE